MRGRLFAFVQTGCRVALFLSIFVASVLAGMFALRHIDDRAGVPVLADVWAALRGRPFGTSSPADEGPESLCVLSGGDELLASDALDHATSP